MLGGEGEIGTFTADVADSEPLTSRIGELFGIRGTGVTLAHPHARVEGSCSTQEYPRFREGRKSEVKRGVVTRLPYSASQTLPSAVRVSI